LCPYLEALTNAVEEKSYNISFTLIVFQPIC
jgi:hypothetical protein